jgi:hypothetical protein
MKGHERRAPLKIFTPSRVAKFKEDKVKLVDCFLMERATRNAVSYQTRFMQQDRNIDDDRAAFYYRDRLDRELLHASDDGARKNT